MEFKVKILHKSWYLFDVTAETEEEASDLAYDYYLENLENNEKIDSDDDCFDVEDVKEIKNE